MDRPDKMPSSQQYVPPRLCAMIWQLNLARQQQSASSAPTELRQFPKDRSHKGIIMKKLPSFLILISLTYSLLLPLHAQQPVRPAPDDVIRISTNLVQIDALVTDKDGNPVKDLRVDDFEVLQDGKPQKVVSVTYVDTEPLAPQEVSKKTDAKAPLAPPTRMRRENTGRVLTFVVDDGNCTASRIGMTAAREALEKFIKEQTNEITL